MVSVLRDAVSSQIINPLPLLMLCTIVQKSGLNLIFEQNAIERES